MEPKQKISFSILFVLTAISAFFLLKSIPNNSAVYFLPVGQGDSSLIILETGEKILIDAGPSNQVQSELAKILPTYDRYLDLLIISHGDKDHIAGFVEILERYSVGAVIGTGRKNETEIYQSISAKIKAKQIPFLGLKEKDSIQIGTVKLTILAPSEQEVFSGAQNEASLVLLLQNSTYNILYTGDIGEAVEKRIAQDYPNLHVQVLKVAHHGSRFSSSEEFLANFHPEVAVISVGQNNYGHPAPETLARIRKYTANIFQTSNQQIVKIEADQKGLRVLTTQ